MYTWTKGQFALCSQTLTVVLSGEDLEFFSAQLIITQLAVYSVYFNKPIFSVLELSYWQFVRNYSSSLFSEDYTSVSWIVSCGNLRGHN